MSDQEVSALEAHRQEIKYLRGALSAAMPLLESSKTFLDATMMDPSDHPLYAALLEAIDGGLSALEIGGDDD